MSEWKESVLGEIAFINPTESLSKGQHAKKVAMELLKPFTKRVSGYTVEPFNGGVKFRNGDTIVARITPCLENGKTAYIDILDENEVGFGSTEYIVLRERKEISDKQFLFYFAISDEFRDVAILAMTGSSGRQRVETEVVKSHPFLLPPLPEQRAIASVLSSLDDKIDLLRRQNKTLEGMAMALWRKMFVEEADPGWETTNIGEVAIINGRSIDRNYPFSEIEYLDTASITEGAISGFQYIQIKDAPSRARRIVQKDDIIISMVRPIQKHYGILKKVNHNTIVSTGFVVISCTKADPHFIYLLLTQKDMTEYLNIIAEASTTAYPSLVPSDIAGIEFQLPPTPVMDQFTKYARSAWDKIEDNYTQIGMLTRLRDMLLPKLMSGEVRIA